MFISADSHAAATCRGRGAAAICRTRPRSDGSHAIAHPADATSGLQLRQPSRDLHRKPLHLLAVLLRAWQQQQRSVCRRRWANGDEKGGRAAGRGARTCNTGSSARARRSAAGSGVSDRSSCGSLVVAAAAALSAPISAESRSPALGGRHTRGMRRRDARGGTGPEGQEGRGARRAGGHRARKAGGQEGRRAGRQEGQEGRPMRLMCMGKGMWRAAT